MKFIQTNYLPLNTEINLADTRIYSTTCEDKHFIEIIDANKDFLEGEYIITNLLYVLMENECIEETKNFFASISIHKEHKDQYVYYYPCIITSESLLDSNTHLIYLIEKVIEYLSTDNSFFSFDKQHINNIRILGNEQKILTKLLTICGLNPC